MGGAPGGGYPPQGGYYPPPPQQAYGGMQPGGGGYYGNAPPQPVYIQRPQQDGGDVAQGCCACLAAMLACFCLEELCMALLY